MDLEYTTPVHAQTSHNTRNMSRPTHKQNEVMSQVFKFFHFQPHMPIIKKDNENKIPNESDYFKINGEKNTRTIEGY